jgi:hypothetical protein
LYKKHRGQGVPGVENSISKEEETLHSSTEWPITGEHEIDIGLRRRPSEDFFIKGPVFLSEVIPVGKMPGKTLIVYLLIVHRVTYSRREWVTLPTYILKEWGISVEAKADALKRLEQAGKIGVQRPKGYSLKVQLIRKPKNWNPKP